MKCMTPSAAFPFSRRLILAGTVALLLSASASRAQMRETATVQKAAEAVTIDLQTTAGNIQIEVYPDRAPKVVTWFLQQVDAKILNGTKFFRSGHLQGQLLRPRFIEGGILSPFVLGENGQKPRTAADAGVPMLYDWESTHTSGLHHSRGSVSLARDITGQGGVLPDMVIGLEPLPELDAGGGASPDNKGFPVIGQVVAGMDVVEAMAHQARDGKTYVHFLNGQILSEPVQILRIARHPAGQVGAP